MAKRYMVPAGFHSGSILEYLAAMYGTLQQVVGELAQNFIDSGASQAHIILDLVKNSISAIDNGGGASRNEVELHIQNIGKSSKTKRKGMIGRKGIGFIAPLALHTNATRWSLITHATRGTDSKNWFEFLLDTEDLSKKKDVLFEKRELPPGYKLMDMYGNIVTGATTCASATNLEPIALAEAKRMDNPATWLCHTLATTYSAAILKHGIKILVTVKIDEKTEKTDTVRPQSFPGDPRRIVVTTKKNQEVVFDWYVSRLPNKKSGKLLFMHEDLVSFPMSGQKDMWPLLKSIFGSGYFQGYVRIPRGFCTLNPSRTKFIPNKDYAELFDIVADFHRYYAEPWHKELREESRTSQSLRILKNVIDRITPLFDEFPDLLASFRGVVQGPGHPPSDPDILHPAKTPADRESVSRYTGEGESHPVAKRPIAPATGRAVGASSEGNLVRCAGGFAVRLVEADPESPYGTNWRIRLGDSGFEKGMVLLNRSHPDWKASESQTESSHDTYMTLLFLEIMSLSRISGDRASIFKEEFERTFLQLRKPLVPRIPSSGKKSKSEPEEEEEE